MRGAGPGAALAALLLAAAAPGCGGAGAAAAPARNIVLITLDTLRADYVGAYGSRRVRTPAIDGLASDGVLFERAYSTMPLTFPSHASMMTGLYPVSHGVRMNGTAILPESATTLAEVAKRRGMRTAAIVSCLVLASRFGLNQGFDLYYEEGISGAEGQHGLWYDERKAARSVDRAVRWLRAESDRPFFLWLHLFDPHHPYDPPPPFRENYRERPYSGEVVYTDRALGNFLRVLKEVGHYDDSLILLAGDHGESLGEHLENFHGVFVYDVTTHVPLIVKAPGGLRGARVGDVASTVDIFPTALEALGEPIPDDVQGFSLLPAATGAGRVPARTLYLESIYPSATYGWAEVRAVRTPDMKFIDLPKPELYDLEQDPRELNNLVARDPARLQRARERYRETVGALEEAEKDDAASADLDEDFRNRLLSLGYIAGSDSTLRRGEPRDPKDVVPLTEPLGYAGELLRKRKYDEALKLLTQVVAADPENKLGLVKYGQALNGAGRKEEARAALLRALDIYPDAEEIYRILGWFEIQDRRYDEAIALMARLVAASPRSAQAHYLYGFTYFRAGRWDRALAAFAEALALNPRQAKALYLTAICEERLGHRDRALAALESYLRVEPDVESLFRDPFLAALRGTPEFSALVRRHL